MFIHHYQNRYIIIFCRTKQNLSTFWKFQKGSRFKNIQDCEKKAMYVQILDCFNKSLKIHVLLILREKIMFQKIWETLYCTIVFEQNLKSSFQCEKENNYRWETFDPYKNTCKYWLYQTAKHPLCNYNASDLDYTLEWKKINKKKQSLHEWQK